MNFMDLLRGRKRECQVENSEEVSKEVIDVPDVIFEDIELQVMIGWWLGLLSLPVGYDIELRNGIFLGAKEYYVSKKQFDEITFMFGMVLKKMGIDSNETCVLSQFDKDKFMFHCHFNEMGKSAKISMEWGDMIDVVPELTIDYDNLSKTYEFYSGRKNREMRLELTHYEIMNSENGNVLWHDVSAYRSSMGVNCDEYHFLLEVDQPVGDSSDLFRLKNEKELEQYLLGLSFPVAIDEVYHKICDLALDSMYIYPSLLLKVEKEINGETVFVTDLVATQNGQMTDFTITRDGRTISIDKFGKWTYLSPKVIANESDHFGITFHIRAEDREQIDGMISPKEEFERIDKEVQDVKKLTKTLF